jgi:hydroxymethylpyrimidine/phosphomethylpyrimidine kinase
MLVGLLLQSLEQLSVSKYPTRTAECKIFTVIVFIRLGWYSYSEQTGRKNLARLRITGNMASRPPIVLSVAGFDPSSGAGVTADIKTIAAHGCYGVSCITSLTVQSTAGVRRVEPIPPELVTETLEELVSDVAIAAIHIGMLGTAGVVRAVAQFLMKPIAKNVVLDPVLKSSSGTDLLDAEGTRLLAERLIPLATVVTPNLDEASALTGLAVRNLDEMRAAARRLHELGSAAVVITGGHLEQAIDLLSFTRGQGIEQEVFKSARLRSSSTHGTGCAFASSLACHLAFGRGLPEGVLLAKAYVAASISHAHPVGGGTGPIHHLYRMQAKETETLRDSKAVR